MSNNWTTSNANVSFKDISSMLSTNSSKVNKVFNGTSGSIGSVHNGGLFQADMTVVGINANKVDDMKKGITTYVNGINETLDKMKALDASSAFMGDKQGQAIKNYIASVKKACTDLTNGLLDFAKKLDEVKAAYLAKDTNVASSVDSNAQTIASSINTGN